MRHTMRAITDHASGPQRRTSQRCEPRFGLAMLDLETPRPPSVSLPQPLSASRRYALWHAGRVTLALVSNDAGAERPTGKRIGSGRAGPVRAALRKALAEARENRRMTTEHEVTAVLAERIAALVDIAAAAGDGRGMLAAAKELRDLLDALPVRDIRGEAPADDGNGPRAAIVELFTSEPTLGNAADS